MENEYTQFLLEKIENGSLTVEQIAQIKQVCEEYPPTERHHTEFWAGVDEVLTLKQQPKTE